MTRLIAFVLLALTLGLLNPAHAAPRCEPAPIGTGTYSHVEQVDGVGEWAVHYCRTQCAWEPQVSVRAAGYQLRWPSVTEQQGMTARQLYRSVWELNATTPMNDPALLPLSAKALRWAIDNEPDRPACTVAPTTSTATTRPAYVLDGNGRLGHLSTNRAVIGARCLCAPGQRVIGQDGSATYCAWAGAQIEPVTEVAVCRPAP